jgi:hypothetical protein
MAATDEEVAATDATAKRKRVVTSKPTKNGCRTCRFVPTFASRSQHIV